MEIDSTGAAVAVLPRLDVHSMLIGEDWPDDRTDIVRGSN